MDTAVYVISILMWILCPAIIGLILLQGAAGDISSAFGGGGQLDASLGVGAHRKMAQVTGALAVLFFIMVLIMAYPHRGGFGDAKATPAPATVPANGPAAPAPQPEATTPVLAPVVEPMPAPEAAKPADVPAPEAAKPADVPAPEAAKPPEVPAPEAAKPAEVPAAEEVTPAEPASTTPTLVPETTPTLVPTEPAKP